MGRTGPSVMKRDKRWAGPTKTKKQKCAEPTKNRKNDGPGRLRKRSGPGGATVQHPETRSAGPGRGLFSKKKMPIIQKFDGQGRAAAHEIWAPYGSLGPAHEVAHVVSMADPGRGQ